VRSLCGRFGLEEGVEVGENGNGVDWIEWILVLANLCSLCYKNYNQPMHIDAISIYG
jgi:hypothetical protein